MIPLQSLFRKKGLGAESKLPDVLHRCLTAFDLTLLGVGAIIGAGVFVLTGIAASTKAGPAVIFSYLFAAFASICSALSYAELSASIGGCGSAYGYAFAGFGEFVAWVIGWNLLLEYGMACSTVAIGWAGYVHNALSALGIPLPTVLTKNPSEGGWIDLPAVIIILIVTALLSVGTKESSRFNKVIVLVKLLAIALFIGIAAFHINPANWHPFLPFGWTGVVQGAALIFFAFIGFDAVSTAAEEAINPERDLPIGIVASVIICTIIYVIVAAFLTGIANYSTLNVSSPVSFALLGLGYRFAAALVAVGAIAGLTTVILVMYYGFTRIFLAMSRDGLLPARLATIHPKTKTPTRIIISVGVIMALIAGFTPIAHAAELVNIGTLFAFAMVCGGVVILRYRHPNLRRPFKTPLFPAIPLLGCVSSIYLITSLSSVSWWRFLIWTFVGLILYFAYGRYHSILAKK